MDRDRKSTPLKELQGLIWEEGYRARRAHGSTSFPTSPRALERWHRRSGFRSASFLPAASSRSVCSSRHSIAGDLTRLAPLAFRHDGRVEAAIRRSYRRIGETMNVAPEAVLFVSDVVRSSTPRAQPECRRVCRSGRERVATRRTFTRDAPRFRWRGRGRKAFMMGRLFVIAARRRAWRWPQSSSRPSEPARLGQPADRRNEDHDRIQPPGGTGPRTVRRARAVGSRLVPGRRYLHEHRVVDRRQDRRARTRGRLLFALGRAGSRAVDDHLQPVHARLSHALSGRSGRAAHPGDAQDRPLTWKR